MRWKDIQGNGGVVDALRSMVDRGRIPHAILLHEDDGGGAMPLVLAFLQYLYCTDRRDGDSCGVCPDCNKVSKLIHPDIHFVYPVVSKSSSDSTVSPSLSYISEWRSLVTSNPSFFEAEYNTALGMEQKSTLINVAEAASILSRLSLSAVEGGYRSVVMYLPEKMNSQAANKLLKMIEEPPEKTLFLLITHSPEKVLTTIFSRCLLMRVLPQQRSRYVEQGLPELFYDMMNALVAHDLAAALETVDEMTALPSREKQKSFLKYAAEGIRNVFLLQQGLPQVTTFPEDEEAFYKALSKNCKRTFARNGLGVLDRSLMLLERNVSQKILFTDMVCKLYRLI